MGEAKRKRSRRKAAQPEGTTHLAFKLMLPDGHEIEFAVAFTARGIGPLLHAMDAGVATKGYTCNGAKSWIIDTFEEGPVQADAKGKWVSETLLWIACRDHSPEKNAFVEEWACQGGMTVGITAVCDATDRMTWGVIVGPTDEHPLRHVVENVRLLACTLH